MSKHHKSRDRIAQLGEVFTPPEKAREMVDMVDDDKFLREKFFDPCCGTGNIFIAGLKRKLDLAHKYYSTGEMAKETAVRWAVAYAVSTSFAVDVDIENVGECRERAINTVKDWINSHFKTPGYSALMDLTPIIGEIELNVEHGDALSGMCDDYESAYKASRKTRASANFFDKYGFKQLRVIRA